jgi:hypothetical protein
MARITGTGRLVQNSLDEYGRVVFANGLDENGMFVFGAVLAGRTQIGTVKIRATSGLLTLPVYQLQPTDIFRVRTASGTGSFELVNMTDPKASPLRVQTKSGVKSVKKL